MRVLGCSVEVRFRVSGFRDDPLQVSSWISVNIVVPLKYIVALQSIKYGVYGDPFIIYPKPYSIYLRGTIYICIYCRVWVYGLGLRVHGQSIVEEHGTLNGNWY